MGNNVIREKIGDKLEVLIEGIPAAVVTPEVKAKAALALIKHGIPTAGVISAGILGGIKSATLQIGSEYYQLKYSIRVLKVMTALDIYSEAIQWIEFQKATNRVDAPLADDAIEYLRALFRKEFR